MLGTVPDEVADPIMIEVFGINGHSLKVMQRGNGPSGRRSSGC